MSIIIQIPLLVLLCIAILIFVNIILWKKNNERIKKLVNKIWAKLPDSIANEEDMKSVSAYFENVQNNSIGKKYIDNITWNDLDLDKVYNKINNTLSTVGEEYLYNLLRCPVFQESEFNERKRLINSFQKDNNNRRKVQILLAVRATDLYHPLLKNPKPYSFSFNKPVLVTGSNASGKSTFLKSVAINAVLAQTIYTCLAREFHISHLMIYTSMALKDNLSDNESYFIVELKSLKRIIDAINSGIPCLCIIDEVLRGTNTIERIAASSEVLYSLINNNCICMAATHDIELTAILEGIYENYHFREEVTEDNFIVFDYKLYTGKSCTKNALKLLKIIGYNSSIVKRAQERSDKFISEGVWEKSNVM